MLRKLLVILLLVAFNFSESYSQKDSIAKSKEALPPVLGDIYKPTVGFGVGMLSYYGDLYTKHAQPFATSRIGYELVVSQPLSKSFYLNFYGLAGKLGANERLGLRNENFQSEIRMGGLRVMYDFSHLFKTDEHSWRPWIETGVEGFEFLTKTDLKDKSGFKYYYWSDGTIKNMAETDPNALNAVNLVRDYTYETDVRELNADGFGKYRESSWAVPIGGGVLMHVGERATFKIGTTFHFTFTDYLDGISNTSVGVRAGTKAKDKFVMTSFSVHYDLVTSKKTKEEPEVNIDNIDMLAYDNEDEDGDGVIDFLDDCHKTPKIAKVDKKGCPVDDDKDLTPDYYDEELPTPASMIANTVGIGITDEMAQLWYDVYYDSTGVFATNVDLDSTFKKKAGIADPNSTKKEYTVELARFKGGVPSDIMAYLLSIGDVRSTTIGDETVIYTAGLYPDIKVAIQRKDEFVEEGIKDAKVGYFKGGKYYEIKTEAELKKEIEASAKANINNTNGAANNNVIENTKGIVYRVQLGAYKQPLSPSLFKHVGKVIELKTDDGYYKYVTESFNSLDKAMIAKADVTLEGYSDAFVSAYKDGKRIPLSQAGATFEDQNDAKNEVLDESKNKTSALDKTLVTFRIQIGALKKSNDAAFEERIKGVKDLDKIVTATGLVRYTSGSFTSYNEAVKAKGGLAEIGFNDAFVIAMFKGEVISIQEALEILGTQK